MTALPDALNDLLQRSARALSSGESLAEDIDAVEDYVKRFSQWYGAYEEELRGGASAAVAPELRLLLERHQEVMERVCGWLSDTSTEMRKLQGRAKAILAYAGKAPAPPSIGRAKKG